MSQLPVRREFIIEKPHVDVRKAILSLPNIFPKDYQVIKVNAFLDHYKLLVRRRLFRQEFIADFILNSIDGTETRVVMEIINFSTDIPFEKFCKRILKAEELLICRFSFALNRNNPCKN